MVHAFDRGWPALSASSSPDENFRSLKSLFRSTSALLARLVSSSTCVREIMPLPGLSDSSKTYHCKISNPGITAEDAHLAQSLAPPHYGGSLSWKIKMAHQQGEGDKADLIQVRQTQQNLAISIVLEREQVHIAWQPLRVLQEACLPRLQRLAKTVACSAKEQDHRVVHPLLQGPPVFSC